MSCSDSLTNLQISGTAIIDPPGFILNLLCVFCIAKIIWNKRADSSTLTSSSHTSNMFSYLFVKAVCDCIFFANDIFYLLGFNCGATCAGYPSGSLAYIIWNIYFYTDMDYTLLMISSMMEVAATLGINKITLLI
jgi:hypothetical protein